ncbi:MAG TPA: ABC transporter ATP-binding protein [Alphaproteobacteria bacterium]|nr:ABC transporter ATP-binding protein [Alphaproteobacteria bacterium]
MTAPPYRLELRGITKRYPGIVANDDVSLAVKPGEIHAVLGENGAGKSTLMKIIYGAAEADAGTILWNGEPVTIANPAAARRLGIGMVYQHFSLFESVTVVENIAVATPGKFDLGALSARVRELSQRYGLPVDPGRLLHHLSVGERQRVEIIRCLLQDPKLLILDEPTSVLTPQAVRSLFAVLRKLVAEGCSILYISHKLDEIRELCDSATILRAGRVSGTANPRTASNSDLARLMVGNELPDIHRDPVPHAPKARLEAIGLSAKSDDPFGTDLETVSLTVHGGEIFGIAGVSGNGQAELLSLLSGERPAGADMVQLDGKPVGDLTVAARRARGLAFVPEERLGRGAVPAMSLADNTLLTAHAAGMIRRGLIDRQRVVGFADAVIARFGVKATGPAAIARSLSGGNLQKLIVGREISLKPHVLIVSQPTWGVDVAAAAFIRQSLIDLSRQGAAVLVISEELEELFQICDRIAVIYQGRLSPARARAATNVEEVGLLMAGVGPSFRPAA